MTWKQLNGYYKVYKKAINVSKGLINRGNIKEVESDQIRKFNKEMTEAIESLVDQYVATKDPTITFQEFVQENPDSVKPFLDLLNRDIKLTHSVIGSSLSVLTVISHIRGIPRIEIANYHRFLYILMIMISFFIVYAIDISK